LELRIELGSEPGDLRGVDLKAAEFFEHLGDPACGDTLKIHFSDGSLKKPLIKAE